MKTFVLVHGAWHGGWCYQKLARILRSEGHEVYTPTLSGVGERSHIRGITVTLETHIQDVLNVIAWEGLDDVILCGHSYGGFVITGVADRIPRQIAALVYLDAFIPDDGDSIVDMASLERQSAILKGAAAIGGDVVPPPPVETFEINEVDQDWVRTKMTAHPLASFVQAIRLQGQHMQVSRRIAVIMEGRPTATRYYERLRNDPRWTVRLFKGGHHPMLDQPEAVAEVLHEAAG